MPDADRGGFVERHGLWGDADYAAAAQLRRVLDEQGIELVRLSFCDQHGSLRGKTLTRDALWGALRDGCTAPSSLLLKDTSGKSVYPVFTPGAGIGIEGLAGAGDLVLVPDPGTFRVLPWAQGTGWLLCDLYFPDGTPVPLSTRELCRKALTRLGGHGYELTVGVELEFHVFRTVHDGRDPARPGAPGEPPVVAPLTRGAQLLHEEELDSVDDVVHLLHDGLTALDLPVRSIELEFGPNQLEVTLAPRPGLAAADAVVLCRGAIRQLCRRNGYHATFMSRPLGADTASAGWHLHQSLVDSMTGENAFVSTVPGAVLSETGMRYLAGLLRHAAAAAVFATPTVNGYKRYQPFSLAPDRIVWGVDNKGAMVRAVGGAATRLENRSGEPAANPYLYVASQVVSGLAGIEEALDPGPPTETPYAAEAPRLPGSLMEALDALERDPVFAPVFGREVVDWFVTLKRAEVARYLAEVSAWEQREYFGLF
ncbi:glutamine synthetase [Amycolatopsis sp. K13G38]|uniref:glutamine synthetase n=2 Tax=Amycolatopsis acididurans TaxID=2724524 RepID=A0ABX1IV80_9PSEU|nr:glutamine synthetase [Amycolatopsis acididurans]